MHRFWDVAVKPVLEAIDPEIVIEVGSQHGDHTRLLVEHLAARGATLHVIDPEPQFDTAAMQERYGDAFVLHPRKSLEALPEIAPADVVLIDGDHNWYTVLHELRLLQRIAREAGGAMPLVMLHDVQWPYGRRDMYHDVDAIPAAHRQPHRRAGLRPGNSAVTEEGGINAHICNALQEHGVRNGVRTAIDDFLVKLTEPARYVEIGGLHGLGIITAGDMTQRAGKVLEQLQSQESLQRQIEAVERDRLAVTVRLADQRAAAARVRAELEEARQRLERLEAELDASRAAVADHQALVAQLSDARSALEHEKQSAARLEREVSARAESGRALEEQIAGLQTAVAHDRKRIAELESTLAAGRDRVAELESALAAGRAQVDELESALAAGREQIAELEGEVALGAQHLTEARAALHEESERSKALQEQIADFEQALALSRERVAALEQALDSRDKQLAEAGRALDSERERVAELESAAVALERDLAQLHDEREAIARERDRAEALAERRAGLLVESRRRDQKRRRQVAVEAAKAARHEAQAGQAREQVVGLQADLARTQETITVEVERARELEQRLTAVEDDRDAAGERATRAEARLSTVEERERTLATERDDLRARLSAAEAQQRRLRSARSKLEQRLAERDGLIEQARGHVALFRRDAGRVAASRSWRMGHATMRFLRRLALRPPKGSGAVAALVHDAEKLRELLDEPPNGSPDDRPDPAADDAPAPGPRHGGKPSTNGHAPNDQIKAVLAALPASAPARAWPQPSRDRRGILVDDPLPAEPSVDVVVCVHDALEDVHRCLCSLLEHTSRPVRLIVIDDGSGEPTAGYLDEFARLNPAVRLKRNSAAPHGYTIAANIGLRAGSGDYVVLLNSDTIVTDGWIERMVDLGERHPAVGIIGPLSNAASHQSVPRHTDGGDWAVNELPSWLTEQGMAAIVARLPGPDMISVPFLNGFCYVIRRRTIDAVGLFDEESFAAGYSEENDYSRRAAAAGFELAVCTRSYVWHAKSRSYGHAERRTIAKAHYRKFLARHGEEHVRELVAGQERDPHLSALRSRVADVLTDPRQAVAALPALSVTFVLPGMSAGGSGGSHSIYQEVSAMRTLGIAARIAVAQRAWKHAAAAYEDADEVFVAFDGDEALARLTRDDDVVVATHYKSMALVAELARRRSDMLPAYYLQDYEPLFSPPGSAERLEAERSYSLIPGAVLFAKTRWLCDLVAERHGVAVAKVEPSLDTDLFHPRGRTPGNGRVRIAAMIRPRTPRRAPETTLEVLRRLAEQHGDAVELTTFGCEPAALAAVGDPPPQLRHRGILTRRDLAELMRETDVFVDCSWYQAFGRTGLEAMACGAVPVLPEVGGAGEFVDDGQSGLLVDTTDPGKLYERIADLVNDYTASLHLPNGAAASAAQHTSLRAAVSEYIIFVGAWGQ